MPGALRAVESEFVVVDFESTGAVAGYATEPWQIGLVFFAHGQPASDYSFSSLLRVGPRPFNPYAPGRHAVLRDDLATAPLLTDLWPTLSRWLLGRPLVAHNVATERKLLGEAFPLHHFGPWIDTLALSRIAYPNAETHKLEELLGILGLYETVSALCPDRAPHDALFDAVASAVLLGHLLDLPHWEGVSTEDLASARSRRASGTRR